MDIIYSSIGPNPIRSKVWCRIPKNAQVLDIPYQQSGLINSVSILVHPKSRGAGQCYIDVYKKNGERFSCEYSTLIDVDIFIHELQIIEVNPIPISVDEYVGLRIDGGELFVQWKDGNDIHVWWDVKTNSGEPGKYVSAMSCGWQVNVQPNPAHVVLTAEHQPTKGPQLQSPVVEIIGPPEPVVVVVGERVHASVRGINSTVRSVTWVILGEPIAGFDESRGIPIQLAESMATQRNWCWTEPGVFSVTVTAYCTTASGPGFGTNTFYYRVASPVVTAKLVLASEGNIDVINNQFITVDPGPAVTLACQVQVNGCTGKLRMTQLLKERHCVERDDSTQWEFSTGQFYYLDAKADDEIPSAYITDKPMTQDAFTVHDTPRQELLHTQTMSEVDLDFHMYIRFRSSKQDSIFVTLGVIPWSLKMTANKGENNSWVVDPTNSAKPITKRTDQIPENRSMCVWNNLQIPDTPRYTILSGDPSGGAPSFPSLEEDVLSTELQSTEERQIIFRYMMAPLVRTVPMYAFQDCVADIGRELGPELTYKGKQYYQVWSTKNVVENATGVFDVQILPLDARHGDLSTEREPLKGKQKHSSITFSLSVAPFCYGNKSYWNQYAHEPKLNEEYAFLSDKLDYSFQGYVTSLINFLGDNGKILEAKNGHIWFEFIEPPERSVLDAILSWRQTNYLRRVPDSEPRIFPGEGSNDVELNKGNEGGLI